MKFAAAAIFAASIAAPALAAPVQIANTVFVERSDDTGASRVLEPARTLRRGDKLVYMVSWRAAQSRPQPFTITNPLPRTVSYQRSAAGNEEVSVDGGRTWGRLESLRVRDGGRLRQASPEDVTHVRWRVPPQLALAGRGQLTWSGVVR